MRVFGGLVQLVEADRHRLQKDVVAATVEVGVGDVGEQTELGRQHLSGARRVPSIDQLRLNRFSTM
jgi:hypothetical protein